MNYTPYPAPQPSDHAGFAARPARVEPPTADTFAENVPISACFLDPSYGRPATAAGLAKLRRRWNTRGLGTIYLSLRADGRYAILDGNHRLTIAREKGVTHVPARVYIDLTPEEEAELFVLFNTQTTAGKIDSFRAMVAAGDDRALAVIEIVGRHGFKLPLEHARAQVNQAGYIAATAAVLRIAERDGLAILDQTIAVLVEAWGRETRIDDRTGLRRAITRESLDGVARFLTRYAKDPRFDRHRLVWKLQDTPPAQVERAAAIIRRQTGFGQSQSYALAVLDVYNHALKTNRLPAWGRATQNGEA